MHRPTLYLDTTIISAYWYDGLDLVSHARRLNTREWWEIEHSQFEIWISDVTEDELREGLYRHQSDTLAMARRLRYLPVTRSVHELAARLLAARIVPESKPRDALQMAVATVHEIDYLLTWNYAHLANASAQQRLGEICRKAELACPLLVSPETVPRASFGQVIRRSKKWQ
jgi:predicted nucleic acid-binding protein